MLTVIVSAASCSFTTKVENDPDKDKLLIDLISYVLSKGHYDAKEINDNFSKEVFDDYIDALDPLKRYFYASDIAEFEKYKKEIDDQIKAKDIAFFNLTYERLQKRMIEARELYQEILERPFNFEPNTIFTLGTGKMISNVNIDFALNYSMNEYKYYDLFQ